MENSEPHQSIENQYYDAFRNRTIVVSADRILGGERKQSIQVLRSLQILMNHKMQVVLAFGESRQLYSDLRRKQLAFRHSETNKLVVTEDSLPKLHEQRLRIKDELLQIADNLHLPIAAIAPDAIRLERRVGHRGTGTIRSILQKPFRDAIESKQLALVGFEGETEEQERLYVPAETLAAEIAVQLDATKLMLLEQSGCLMAPSQSGGKPIRFLDLEQLLCLLQRRDSKGNHVVSGQMVSTLHNAIRAVAGGVEQVHIVSGRQIIPELTTRTGAGTLIEKHHTHTVSEATPEDIEDIEFLHQEAASVQTTHGTSLVIPQTRSELIELLPHTLVLKHRDVVIGKIHSPPLTKDSCTAVLGGYCIGENHQNWQHGRLLLQESLERLYLRGMQRAVAVTASAHAAKSFEQLGKEVAPNDKKLQTYFEQCKKRYNESEHSDIQMFEIDLTTHYNKH